MVRFDILLWLSGPEKFPGLSRNGPLVGNNCDIYNELSTSLCGIC